MQLVGAGLVVLGARIVGDLTLAAVQPPFGISLIKCEIPERISLQAAHLRWLALSGSYTGQIYAPSVVADLGVLLDGVHSSGVLDMDSARIDGPLLMAGAHFQHQSAPLPGMADAAPWNLAVRIAFANIRGFAGMTDGFEADGGVQFDDSTVGGDFSLCGSRFINPDSVFALTADADKIVGDVILSRPFGLDPDPARFQGPAFFIDDEVGGYFSADHVVFDSRANRPGGLAILNSLIKGSLFLRDIELRNGATLNLTGSSAHVLVDDETGWPGRGKLSVDGFSYDQFVDPISAEARLRWLSLQDGFHPQPYRQLAKYLRESGDESGAIKVLVAKEDLRYGRFGLVGRFWGGLLKWTIGYGHRPLLTLMWSFGVVLIGWVFVWAANRSGVMRRTWPENMPRGQDPDYEPLHPFLYSLDVFLPFVDLHQEHYWWPSTNRSGECVVFGRHLRVNGRVLRYYLWIQVIAGWLLSAIFVAAVTGLMRND